MTAFRRHLLVAGRPLVAHRTPLGVTRLAARLMPSSTLQKAPVRRLSTPRSTAKDLEHSSPPGTRHRRRSSRGKSAKSSASTPDGVDEARHGVFDFGVLDVKGHRRSVDPTLKANRRALERARCKTGTRGRSGPTLRPKRTPISLFWRLGARLGGENLPTAHRPHAWISPCDAAGRPRAPIQRDARNQLAV